MQDFLNLRKPGGASGTAAGTGGASKEGTKKEEVVMMTIQVLLADKRVVTASVKEHWKTRDVYQVREEKGMDKDCNGNFGVCVYVGSSVDCHGVW